MRRFVGRLVLALTALAAATPVWAGSAANTRWYGSVNRHAVVVREAGKFHVVDDQSGYTLYETKSCKKRSKSEAPEIARKLGSSLIYFCTRDDKRTGKWAWSDSEFHWTTAGGKGEWRLVWLSETKDDNGKPLSVDARIKAARIVKELPDYDAVLDGIACTLSFEKATTGTEWVSLSSPFGNCADKKVSNGALPKGEFACQGSVDPTFLGRRKVTLANRGDAGNPQFFLVVSGREPKACTVRPSQF